MLHPRRRNWPNYPVWMTQKPKKGDFGKLKSKKFPIGTCPGPPKSLRFRCSFRKSVRYINPRSAPASRFCPCFTIKKLKQRRFWVMRLKRKWILYPFKMPWWYQTCILQCLFSQGNDLREKKMVKYAPKDCKNATSGWSEWLKKHPMCLKTSYYNYWLLLLFWLSIVVVVVAQVRK